jgi:RES domain-containing protein
VRIFRLCKANRPSYSGKGAGLYGGRWNSKGTPVLYMSESRALAVLEVLVHLAAELPDRYVLGGADIPPDLEVETISENDLPSGWRSALPSEQSSTRKIGDEWVRSCQSAVVSVPSVIVAERNFLLNPVHPQFKRAAFLITTPFDFDSRLLEVRSNT